MYTWILLISVVFAQAHRAPPSSSDHVINDPALNAVLSHVAIPNNQTTNSKNVAKNDRSFMASPQNRNLNREIDVLALVPSPVVVTSAPPTLPTVSTSASESTSKFNSELPSDTNIVLSSSIPVSLSVSKFESSSMSTLSIPTSSYVFTSIPSYNYSESVNSLETSVDYSYSSITEESQQSTEEVTEETTEETAEESIQQSTEKSIKEPSTLALAVDLDVNSCASNTLNQATVILLCIITLALS